MALLLSLEFEPLKVTGSVASPVIVEGIISIIGGALLPATPSLVIENGEGVDCGFTEPPLKMAVRVKSVMSFSSDILLSMAIAFKLLMGWYRPRYLSGREQILKVVVVGRCVALFNMDGGGYYHGGEKIADKCGYYLNQIVEHYGRLEREKIIFMFLCEC